MKKKEISLFSVGIFFLTVPKNFVGGSIQYFRKIQARKNSMHRKGLSIFSVETFFLTVPKSLVRGIIQRFRNNRVSKNFIHMKGLSLFSVETSFFSQCRKIWWEELINVSEILVHGKYL